MPKETHSQGSPTRFADLSRGQALLVMAGLCALLIAGLAVSWGQRPKLKSDKGEGDLPLYSHVVQRIRHGEGYYEALGAELQARDYPMRSPFNWRTPLHLEVVAHLPETSWARVVLALGALYALILAVAESFGSGEYGFAVWRALLLCVPLAIAAMDPIYLLAEVWAGVAIAISIGMYSLGWRKSAAVTGILALFFRELALPYVLIGVVLAIREKKRSEQWIWTAGLCGYAVYLGLHAMAVLARMPAANHAPEVSRWIQFGGLRFLLITCRVGFLMAFPFWWAAFYLPSALLGLAGWRHPVAQRILATTACYLLAFSVIGIPSANFYWGGVYAPLLAFGTPWTLLAFKDLLWVALPKTWTAAPAPPLTEAAG